MIQFKKGGKMKRCKRCNDLIFIDKSECRCRPFYYIHINTEDEKLDMKDLVTRELDGKAYGRWPNDVAVDIFKSIDEEHECLGDNSHIIVLFDLTEKERKPVPYWVNSEKSVEYSSRDLTEIEIKKLEGEKNDQ